MHSLGFAFGFEPFGRKAFPTTQWLLTHVTIKIYIITILKYDTRKFSSCLC